MKALFNLAAVFATLLFCGCASVRTMHVDAIASPNASCGKACAIIPANPNVSPNDLRFKEMADVVTKTLEMRGFSIVDDTSRADVILAVDASLGLPRNVEITCIDTLPPEPGFCGAGRIEVRGRDGGIHYVNAAMWYPSRPWPYYGCVDVYSAMIYEKRLALSAYLNNCDKVEELPQLWSTVVSVYDSSPDIRSYVPVLALVAARYAGRDTKGKVDVRVSDDDPDLSRIAPRFHFGYRSEETVPDNDSGDGAGKGGKYLIDNKR
jgi:hypothetical protein